MKLGYDKQKSQGLIGYTINGVAGEPLKPELDWTDTAKIEEIQNLLK